MKSFKTFTEEPCWPGYKMVGMKKKKGKPAFTFPSPTGEMIIKVWLRPMAKPAKSHTKAFNYELDDK